MLSLITAVLALGDQVMQHLNMTQIQEPYNAMKALKTQLLEEMSKGQLSDDGVIEDIEARIKIQADSILTLLATAGAVK